MKKYNFFTFCENLDRIGQETEEKLKKQKIGEIIGGLQRPMQEVLQAVILEQEKQVEKLITALGWRQKIQKQKEQEKSLKK
jgi:hypothetical protein